MTDKIYTIEELEALPDARLNETAAELRYGRTDGFPCWNTWTPATDRTQSGELLDWLTEHVYRANYMAKSGLLFKLIRIEWVDDKSDFQWVQVSGTSARSETIAFCAAMLAQQGRLK